MSTQSVDQVRRTVRERYGKIATREESAYGGAAACCGGTTPEAASANLGYSPEELSVVPEGANMGLGCGNPQTIAALKPGETVLDLGSGGGFDCFLAARRVGETGRVIGVDMTPEMLSLARDNASKGGYRNTEFRLGEIEHLPLADQSVDVIISNCVINLSTDKPSVYREAYRVLRPGGRLAISDVVATAEMPEAVRNDLDLHSGCIAGAAAVGELEALLTEIGFREVSIQVAEQSREVIRDWEESRTLADYVASASMEALRPIA